MFVVDLVGGGSVINETNPVFFVFFPIFFFKSKNSLKSKTNQEIVKKKSKKFKNLKKISKNLFCSKYPNLKKKWFAKKNAILLVLQY